MLVDTACLLDPILEDAERRPEEPREPEQTLGAAVDLGAPLEAAEHQPFERVGRPVPPPQLVVERQDFNDETRAELERRRGPACARVERRPPEDHLALELREPRRDASSPLVQSLVQLGARDDVGKHDGRRFGRKAEVLEGAPERLRGAASRHEHGARTRRHRVGA